jgi:hypothetical protein
MTMMASRPRAVAPFAAPSFRAELSRRAFAFRRAEPARQQQQQQQQPPPQQQQQAKPRVFGTPLSSSQANSNAKRG